MGACGGEAARIYLAGNLPKTGIVKTIWIISGLEASSTIMFLAGFQSVPASIFGFAAKGRQTLQRMKTLQSFSMRQGFMKNKTVGTLLFFSSCQTICTPYSVLLQIIE